MPVSLASVEKRLLALDKKTFYRWLRQDKTGSGFLRYVGGYFFWLVYALAVSSIGLLVMW